MPATTPRRGLPYSLGADLAATIDNTEQSLATALDNVAMDRQGTLAARGTRNPSPVAGDYDLATDDHTGGASGTLSRYDGTSWVPINGPRTFQTVHTYAVAEAVAVPSGTFDYLPPFRVAKTSAQTTKLARVEYRLNNGSAANSVTLDVKVNGATASGFGALVAGGASHLAAWAETDPTDLTLADRDEVAVVVTAIAGSPSGLSVTLVLEHTA